MYPTNKHGDTKIKNTIPLKITQKKLTKYVQNLYAKNYKILFFNVLFNC